MMQLYSFWTLPRSSRLSLVKTAGLVGLIRVGLWILPFRTLRRLLDRLSRMAVSPTPNPNAAKSIIHAVRLSSRYIPKSTCLTQALAAQVILSRRGYQADLRLGVMKNEQGFLEAHAWVESEGQILIGEVENLSNFIPLPPLKGKHQ